MQDYLLETTLREFARPDAALSREFPPPKHHRSMEVREAFDADKINYLIDNFETHLRRVDGITTHPDNEEGRRLRGLRSACPAYFAKRGRKRKQLEWLHRRRAIGSKKDAGCADLSA